jgi:subtilisin family serine protease
MDLRSEKMSNRNTPLEPPLKHSKFWHLEAIGLLLPSQGGTVLPTGTDPASVPFWDGVPKTYRAKVAIIDTGVSPHPYLAETPPDAKSAKEESGPEKGGNFDLTGTPTRRAEEFDRAKLPENELGDSRLKELGLLPADGETSWKNDVLKLIDDNLNKISVNAGAPKTSNLQFSAHGTACAGLVAASEQHYVTSRSSSAPAQFAPPYYRGVDPESEIISITTSFAPRPDLLTLAFVLAASQHADVILFPRGLPREIELAVGDFSVENEGKLNAKELNEAKENLARPWVALKQTIIEISKRIPIVCAVGNECEEKPIAPACFAADDNGIIAVAAMNYFGYRSSYSNFGRAVTIAAPSNDSEIFNIDQARLDKTNRFIADHPYDFFVKKADTTEIPFGEASIRSIDIPGAFGFSDTNSNVDAKIWLEPESYFTEFGGTSAAASIVAGVASLAQRAAKSKSGGKALDGIKMRKLLSDSARKAIGRPPHLPDNTDPQLLGRADVVNGETLSFKDKFGAGLVDAKAAVGAALAGV